MGHGPEKRGRHRYQAVNFWVKGQGSGDLKTVGGMPRLAPHGIQLPGTASYSKLAASSAKVWRKSRNGESQLNMRIIALSVSIASGCVVTARRLPKRRASHASWLAAPLALYRVSLPKCWETCYFSPEALGLILGDKHAANLFYYLTNE